jgi:co-chaperonin GroES (HSP10)
MSNRQKRRVEREQDIAQRKRLKEAVKAEKAAAAAEAEALVPALVPDGPKEPEIPKKYRTLNNHFLVKRLDVNDEMTKSGRLVKPEIARQRSQRGEVRYAPLAEAECPPGTVVIFTKYGGSDIEINGEMLVLVQRLQLYGIEEIDEVALAAQKAAENEPQPAEAPAA